MNESETPFCPATMCPLFAKDGSPWTGDKNSRCERSECVWWGSAGGNVCGGCVAALDQVDMADEGGEVMQIGPIAAKRHERVEPRTFDCPRAAECQWQRDMEGSEHGLCPPREALRLGIDPKTVAR